MAYAERWRAEIAELRRILSGFDMVEETKWGKPCYVAGGANVVIVQGFKEYCALGFFQGALLKDPKKLLVQLGSVQAARVMKFTSAEDIAKKEATIRAYLKQAIAAAVAGEKVEVVAKELAMPEELAAKLGKDAKLKRAWEALTPGRRRGWLFHFADAKQAATRVSRIDKAAPAILDGRGFLERKR